MIEIQTCPRLEGLGLTEEEAKHPEIVDPANYSEALRAELAALAEWVGVTKIELTPQSMWAALSKLASSRDIYTRYRPDGLCHIHLGGMAHKYHTGEEVQAIYYAINSLRRMEDCSIEHTVRITLTWQGAVSLGDAVRCQSDWRTACDLIMCAEQGTVLRHEVEIIEPAALPSLP